MNNIFDTSRCQVNQTPLHLKFPIISNLLCIPFLCSFFQILSFLLSKPGHLADQERTLSLKDVPQVLAYCRFLHSEQLCNLQLRQPHRLVLKTDGESDGFVWLIYDDFVLGLRALGAAARSNAAASRLIPYAIFMASLAGNRPETAEFRW